MHGKDATAGRFATWYAICSCCADVGPTATSHLRSQGVGKETGITEVDTAVPAAALPPTLPASSLAEATCSWATYIIIFKVAQGATLRTTNRQSKQES